MYERKLSDNYKLSEVAEEDKGMLYYANYPTQEIFPCDGADLIILNSVKNSYPKSFAKSRTMISYMDKEYISYLQGFPSEEGTINIAPDFSRLDLYHLPEGQFRGLRINIKIYKSFHKGHSIQTFFYGSYDLRDDRMLSKIERMGFI